MNQTYIVKDNILRLDNGVIPSAIDIYHAYLGKNKNLPPLNDEILKDLDITIEPTFLDVEVEIEVNEKKLLINLYGNLNNEKINLSEIVNNGIDHIIYKNIWLMINKDFIDSIKKDLEKVGIKKFSKISFHQYLDLRKQKNIEYIKDLAIDKIDELFVPSDKNISTNIFKGELRSYQKVGSNFLFVRTADLKTGSLLCDDMGLGKTVQLISLIVRIKESSKNDILPPFLMVLPASLVTQWESEINKFAPDLKVYAHRGNKREKINFAEHCHKFDLILTTYELLNYDFGLFNQIKWSIVFCDEAQFIKNPDAIRTQRIKSLNKEIGIAITGTPLENSIIDCWSIYDFVNPGYLGDLENFKECFTNTVEHAEFLDNILKPFMIRRYKEDVEKELPEKIEINKRVDMNQYELEIYNRVRNDAIQNNNFNLGTLTRLRQICAHPFLIEDNDARNIHEQETIEQSSSKFAETLSMIKEISEKNKKILLFCEYIGLLDFFVDTLEYLGIYVKKIDGSVQPKNRSEIIKEFSNVDGPGVLVCNPIVAGFGLNITSANYVIHYTPMWNPMKTAQATDRAHRIGQKEKVFVYHLYYTHTIEEYVLNIVEQKKELAKRIIGDTGLSFSKEDIKRAIEFRPHVY